MGGLAHTTTCNCRTEASTARTRRMASASLKGRRSSGTPTTASWRMVGRSAPNKSKIKHKPKPKNWNADCELDVGLRTGCRFAMSKQYFFLKTRRKFAKGKHI